MESLEKLPSHMLDGYWLFTITEVVETLEGKTFMGMIEDENGNNCGHIELVEANEDTPYGVIHGKVKLGDTCWILVKKVELT